MRRYFVRDFFKSEMERVGNAVYHFLSAIVTLEVEIAL